MEIAEKDPEYERTLLIGVDTGEYDAEASLDELSRLAQTAGARVFATLIQRADAPDPARYLGSGKLAEAVGICMNNAIDLIICDTELTPTQVRNIEDAAQTRVIDRTTLILDIFARNARTSEGRLQVELAQLKYTLPRLTGSGEKLSRLGGGIGTRGPGESKLESDRRHVRRMIQILEARLDELTKRREYLRSRRHKDGTTVVAVVGYTNSGKSTLMNALTDAGVLCEDKLFATLDPTSRALVLPDGRTVMLIDTVGFIQRLPHELVEAFKSTLEEAAGADLILSVCDSSDPECETHLRVTSDTLRELGAGDIPVLTVYNKCDLAGNVYAIPFGRDIVRISALRKIGLDELLADISRLLPDKRVAASLLFPPDKASLGYACRRYGVIKSERWDDDGYHLEALADPAYIASVKEYIVKL